VQVIINIAVVSGSIPPTGLPLPFISSGTSSIIAFCSAIGILNSIKRYGDSH
jgi:cell division protein FtsW